MGVGDWVIDTKKQQCVDIISVISVDKFETSKTLYIVEDGNGEYYIASEDNIIPYDKYYFKESQDE